MRQQAKLVHVLVLISVCVLADRGGVGFSDNVGGSDSIAVAVDQNQYCNRQGTSGGFYRIWLRRIEDGASQP